MSENTASHRCVYKNCMNSRKNSALSFYKFPVSDEIRCRLWLNNCGNLRLVNEKLDQKVICEDHFPSTAFRDYLAPTKKLNKNAVPLKYGEDIPDEGASTSKSCSTSTLESVSLNLSDSPELKVFRSENVRTYGCKKDGNGSSSESSGIIKYFNYSDILPTQGSPQKPSDSETSSTKLVQRLVNTKDASSASSSPRRKNMKAKIINLKKNLLKKNAANYRLRKTRLSSSPRNVMKKLLQGKSCSVNTLVSMQCFHKKRTLWTKSEKQLALSLYYKSPSNYKFMLYQMKMVLPGISTIQKWLRVYNIKTGVNTKLIEKLKIKVSGMEEGEKQCVVLFDEITLKKGLDYNRFHDFIEGYEDFGNLGRHSNLGNQAVMFYLRGLFYNWKMPFCYYISNGPVKGDTLAKLILEVWQKLYDIDLKPRVVVADQGANNRAAIKKLGASAQNPKIRVNNKDIIIHFDPCHLIKSWRNNVMNKKLDVYVNGKKIDWEDFTKTFEVDKSSNLTRAMVKITDRHINPTNFQKMRVKYAAQVFSNSVAAAIMTCAATKQLQSDTAVDTAHFFKYMNNVFDCLNSKTVKDPCPYKSALSIYNQLPYNTLKNALEYFKHIKFYENGQERRNIYCLEGIQWTINAVLLLWDELQTEGFKYLLTSRLNQDPVENFFSVIRTRGGYNPQPTVKEFRIALQHNMFIKLQAPIGMANCEVDTEEPLEMDESSDVQNVSANLITCESQLNINENLDDEEEKENMCMPSPTGEVTLETCSNVYVAGYLCHYLFKTVKCNKCNNDFVRNNEHLVDQKEYLLLYKDYGMTNLTIKYLMRPTDHFCKIVTYMLHQFNIAFEIYKIQYNVTKKLKKYILNNLDNTYSEWINTCKDHRLLVVNQLIKIKIFRAIKWNVRTADSEITNVKPHRKIRILSCK